MDKNSIIGLLLIGLVMIGYVYLNRPTAEELQAMQQRRDSIEAVQEIVQERIETQDQLDSNTVSTEIAEVEHDSVKNARLQDQLGSFAATANGEDSEHIIENDLMKVVVSSKGGRVKYVELKDYSTYSGEALQLLDPDSSTFGLRFFAQNRKINTSDLYFQAIPASGDPKALTMRLNAGADKYIDFNYKLEDGSYLADYSINLVGLQDIIAPNINYLELNWESNMRKQEKDIEVEKNATALYYKFKDDDVESLSETKSDNEDLATKVEWVSFKNQFFSSILIAENGFDKPTSVETVVYEDNPTSTKFMKAAFTIPYSHQKIDQFDMKFYFGPNHYKTLKNIGLDMEAQIPLGWGIFGWVNRFMVIPTFNFLNTFNLSYGIIILLLTIFIKVILLPLTYKAYLSTAKMKVLKPEIEEIQKKYKGDDKQKADPMKQQQELMALYKKGGVNPLGGCIPIALQMPILIAMFRFFPASIELRQQSFLWADDLSTYDSIFDLPFSIPYYGDHVSLFTLLMAVSTILYSTLNNQMTASANPQMKWMMYLMPVFFLGFFNNYSAGLSYYYFLANVISIGQTFLIRTFIDEDAIHAKIQENKKKPKKAKKSKFQERLEKMAKERGYKPPK